MKHITIAIISVIFVIILLASCVTSIDEALPYDRLPDITVASAVSLVSSPSDPTSYLPLDPIPAGSQVSVVGKDPNSAWLLVLHNNRLGWMPTVFSRTNVGNRKTALVIEPLSGSCARYLGATDELSAGWESDASGRATILGSIYRSQVAAAFEGASLTAKITEGGAASAASYVHVPLTPSSAVALFAFSVDDLKPGSKVGFELTGAGREPLSFQAAFFSDNCPEREDAADSEFVDRLPIGKMTLEARAPQAQNGDRSASAPAQTATQKPNGEVVVEILSVRAGPGFAYKRTGEKLQGETFDILGRLCGSRGTYDWLLIKTEKDTEHWIPGGSDLVVTQNADKSPCLPAPPAPEEPVSSVRVVHRAFVGTGADGGSHIVSDPAELAQFAFAIGRYRLAEKAALNLPNSAAVSQLRDFAQGQALFSALDQARQLRAQRLAAEMAISRLDVKLVVLSDSGIASALVEQAHTLVTYRPTTRGSQPVDIGVYNGPVIYGMVHTGANWEIDSIVLLGSTGGFSTKGMPRIVSGVTPDMVKSVDKMRAILAKADVHDANPNVLIPQIDVTDYARPATTTIEGRISQNTLLEAAASPYVIQGAVTIVPGVTLFVEPGTIVKFTDDAHLIVDGALAARGILEDPIIFTSVKDDFAGGDTNGDGASSAPAPGDWTYIGFRDSSNDASSVIEHAIIRYAGDYRGERYGAIHLEAASPTIINNVFEDNLSWVINADVHSFPIVSGNDLARNGLNGLGIRSGDMAVSGAWRNTDIPYIVIGKMQVNQGATLTIDPGVLVKLADDAYFEIYGAFRAEGLPGEEIIFTSLKDDTIGGDTNNDGASSAADPGDWTYIGFKDSSNDANSIIQYAIIRYAGEYRGERYGAIRLEAASPTIVNNAIEDNLSSAISADVYSFPVVSGNQLARNGLNGLEIRNGDMAISGAWRNTDIPYAVFGKMQVNQGTTLTIEPGVLIKLADDAYFEIYGAFRAEGLAGEEIVFTSLQDDTIGGDTNGDGASSAPTAGNWSMIRFRDSSNDASSVIEHAIIRYAGDYRGERYGAIHLEAASPTIVNTVFEDNLSWAINADVHSFPVVSGNDLARNGLNGLGIRSGDMAISGAWRNTDIPYIVIGKMQVNQGATLTIDPGVLVKLADDAYFEIYGAFRAEGLPGEEIIFTSLQDDTIGGDTNGDGASSAPAAGNWSMIRFRDSSNDANSVIEHAIIRYAGEHRGDRYGAIHVEAASPTIINNAVEESFWYGIWYDAQSAPRLSDNRFKGNVEGDVFQKK